MNKQREAIYGLRRSILEGEDVHGFVEQAIEQAVNSSIEIYFGVEAGKEIDFEGFILFVKSKFNFDLNQRKEGLLSISKDDLIRILLAQAVEYYKTKKASIGEEAVAQLEQIVSLQVIDSKWKDHLYAMDSLKEGIGLRAYAQRDPLIEYQHEAFSMFEEMFNSINDEVVETLFKIQAAKQERARSVFASLPQEFVHHEFSSLSGPTEAERVSASKPPPSQLPAFRREDSKVGRNDPCPCGAKDASGKPIKYKKCHGR
jgi:preprotein translocase subunit SecA